ncbi:MAG: P-II family nitrogen regulator [Bacillota bacterium]|nr:P-II family nitrogen regulator [Bacillota bacterium]
MESAVLLTTIADRRRSEKYESFFTASRIPVSLMTPAVGTASSQILDYMGIGESEKLIFFSVLPEEQAHRLLKEMNKQLRLYIPGTGIAYTIPLSSFAGALALKYLTGSDQLGINEEEKTPMDKKSKELIIAITNHGHVDTLMDAAREAGARGGTVIHALGTGAEQAEKFFGISVAREKDMIFIVTHSRDRNAIMKAIVSKAGAATKAHAIVFSLPVTEIAGLRMDEDDE